MKLAFLGAARQVTGSCYHLEAGGLKLLVECGLYQERPFLDRNWNDFPIPPEDIDICLLTHVHLDHSGLLPRLVDSGFSGTILTTAPTADLLSIALMDSAEIQEEDAAYKRKRHQKEGRTGPHPEIPLYTTESVQATMPLVEEVGYEKDVALNGRVTARFRDAGHILGSAMIEIKVRENGRDRRFVFSGDIGQWGMPFVEDPSIFEGADYVVMESTYGDRDHEDPKDVASLLADVIRETAAAGGNVIIPTFAIERAQDLMFHLSRLAWEKAIPPVPVFLDSPMAREVTRAFERHLDVLDDEAKALFREGRNPFAFPGLKIVQTPDESKAINELDGPAVIMAGSGMVTGGRVKHHLLRNIARPESTVLFVGYQARGTPGRQIIEKSPEIRLLGKTIPVKARIAKINGFSAHADRTALGRWLDGFAAPPRRLFVTHGDDEVIRNFAERVRKERGWTVEAPEYKEIWDLD